MTEHTDEALWRRQYQLLPGLQRKYATVDAYVASQRAEDAQPRLPTGAPVTPAHAIAAPARAPGPGMVAGEATADGWRAEYEASPALQAEFLSAEHYIAFRKAEARGLVAIRRGSVTSSTPAPAPRSTPSQAAPAPVAPRPGAGVTPQPDAIAAEYNASVDLQREFGTLAAYSAWRRNAARGRAIVTVGRVVGRS